MIPDALQNAAKVVLGRSVTRCQRLHGGDLSDVFHLTLEGGSHAVVKNGALVEVEAQMLTAISAAGAPAPRVLGQKQTFLFLEALLEASPRTASWRALGQGLRTLHCYEGTSFGWEQDYAFGKVTIENTTNEIWTDFWATHRLLAASDALPRALRQRLEALASRLPDLIPATPSKSLLHGDLWTGNALFTSDAAYLIDPACYYGDPEVDLAMLHLFGTPPAAFWEGYGTPALDWQSRLPVYQLWPALVHLRLFGDSYRPMVETRLAALGV